MGAGEMMVNRGNGASTRSAKALRLPATRRVTRAPKLALLLVVLLMATGAACAKDHTPTTRIVSGVVFDDAQNTVQGATVELKDLQTGKVLDIYSQDQGQYQFTDIRFDHDYTVQAIFKGASSETRKVSMFETRWHLFMNLTVTAPTAPKK